MKLEVSRFCIRVIPENDMDEAYLEEVMRLRKAGETAVAKRVNAVGMSCWAYMEIRAEQREGQGDG